MTNEAKPLTAADIREIVEESGISHAEYVLEMNESQVGSDNTTEARTELKRLMDEE